MTKLNKSSLAILSLTAILTVGIFYTLSTTNSSLFPTASSQEYATLSQNNPTIKVSGEASLKVDSDQAVMIITKQSQPTDLLAALNDQKKITGQLVDEIKTAVGDDKKTTITVGQMNLNPYYSGPSYSDVDTFTVYSSTSVNTDIESFSSIVKKLTEASFGFESVYASPTIITQYSSGGVVQQQVVDSSLNPSTNETENEDNSKQLTINVALNTKPGKLNDVLEEYQSKYEKLTKLLNEIGIPSDKIQPANVNINPVYYGPGKDPSYNTYAQIIVKTEVKNIEAINQMAQKQGAYVENTFLSISDDTIEQKRDELNQMAFDNAKSRAESMAKLAGLNVKGIQSIETVTPGAGQYGGVMPYKGVYITQPYYYGGMSGELSTSVTVEFELGK